MPSHWTAVVKNKSDYIFDYVYLDKFNPLNPLNQYTGGTFILIPHPNTGLPV